MSCLSLTARAGIISFLRSQRHIIPGMGKDGDALALYNLCLESYERSMGYPSSTQHFANVLAGYIKNWVRNDTKECGAPVNGATITTQATASRADGVFASNHSHNERHVEEGAESSHHDSRDGQATRKRSVIEQGILYSVNGENETKQTRKIARSVSPIEDHISDSDSSVEPFSQRSITRSRAAPAESSTSRTPLPSHFSQTRFSLPRPSQSARAVTDATILEELRRCWTSPVGVEAQRPAVDTLLAFVSSTNVCQR